MLVVCRERFHRLSSMLSPVMFCYAYHEHSMCVSRLLIILSQLCNDLVSVCVFLQQNFRTLCVKGCGAMRNKDCKHCAAQY